MARTCAEFGVATMTIMFHIASVAGPLHVFSEGGLAAWAEPEGFTEGFEAASREQQRRVQELRGLAPSKPR